MMRRILAAVLPMLALVGCVSIQQGALLHTQRLPGTDRTIGETDSLRFLATPTPGDATLSVQLLRRVSVEYGSQSDYRAVVRYNRPGNVAASILFGGLAAALFSHGDSTTSRGRIYNGAGVAAVLVTLGFVVAATDTNSHPPGNEQRTITRTSIGREVQDHPGAVATRVVIKIGATSRSFATDADGIVRADLVNDFGLRYFDHESKVTVVAAAPGTAEPVETSLLSSQWTLACVRAIAAGRIQTLAAAESNIVGQFAEEDRYAVVADSAADWVGIEYRGSIGWIPRLATQSYWIASRSGNCRT